MTTTALQVYRRSELEDIANGCLHRYKALWIDGVDDSSDISLIGVSFAKVKHEYILRLVERGLPSDAEEAKAALIEGIAITQLPARLIPELRSLWDFHTSRFTLNVKRFVAAEERGTGGEVAFAPDLVQAYPEDNALEIVDDKSGWHPPLTESELKRNFQARIYSRYARDRWPNFSRYRFTLYAVRFDQAVTVEFNDSELDAVDTEVQSAIATVELAKASNVWPAIPGPACRFCTLACPVADNKLSLPKRLSLEQRKGVAEWTLVAEKQLRAIKKLLKESVTEHGPIDLNGVVWDNRPSVSRSYPLSAVVAAFKTLKIPVDSATISQYGLKTLIRQYPDLELLLHPAEKQRTSYRFSAKAAGDEDEDEG